MSIIKRLLEEYQLLGYKPNYHQRLEDYLNTLHQNTMTSICERCGKDCSYNPVHTCSPVFGQDTIESLEEKKRKEDQEAEIGRQH
jgi:hypothetical protein